jgi:YHS domain-containing protein
MNFLRFIVFILIISCNSSQRKGAEIYQKEGTAIGGYDPVSFFTAHKPVKGGAEYIFVWKDAKWQFSSQQNLDSFKSSPEKYAPQYGGYCAYGTADGHKAPTEVDTWTIMDGKLYFNYNQDVKTIWDKNRSVYIEKANTNWENIKFSD